VIELQPLSTDGWYHKGFALYHKKQFSEAVRASVREWSCLATAEGLPNTAEPPVCWSRSVETERKG
jgi:hypothetical protein